MKLYPTLSAYEIKNIMFAYRSFLRDVTTATLVYKNNRRSLLWEPNSIFMHIPCIHFVLFCTPIWPPSHVSENHLFQRPLKESKEWRIHVFT